MAKTYLSLVTFAVIYLAVYLSGSIILLLRFLAGSSSKLLTSSLAKTLVSVAMVQGYSLPFVFIGMAALFYLLSVRRWRAIPFFRRPPLENRKVVVTLTAYNEAPAIREAVTEFAAQPSVTETIVVDNGSKDGTGAEALAAGATVVREPVNTGYGGACIRCLREGLKSDAGVVMLSEGDMTFSGADVSKFVTYLDDADMVIGTRTTKELLCPDTQMDTFMTWGNLFLAKLLQVKFFDFKHFGRVRFTDVGCTMRAIGRNSLMRIIDQLEVTGDSFSPHMLMVAMSNGLKIVEIPISFRPRVGASKGASSNKWKAIRVGLRMLWEIIIF